MSNPIKSCETCAFFRPDDVGPTFSYCTRFQTYTSLAMWEIKCGSEPRGWIAKPTPPPRRSLRKWFHDTFLAL